VELLKAIEEEAEKRCREAREKAEAEIQRIREEAAEQIKSARDSARQDSRRKLRQEETVLISEAETKVQRELARVKNETLEKVMEAAREKLASFGESDEYPKVFAELAEEALRELDENFIATVRSQDKKLAREALERLGARNFDVSADGDFSGGLIVTARDGRARVVNTFESRFEEAREEAILRVGPDLFG